MIDETERLLNLDTAVGSRSDCCQKLLSNPVIQQNIGNENQPADRLATVLETLLGCGESGGDRTHDILLKRQTL